VGLPGAGPGSRRPLPAQNRVAGLSTNSSHRQADATHGGLLDEERGAQQSTHAIQDVVRAALTGTTLPSN